MSCQTSIIMNLLCLSFLSVFVFPTYSSNQSTQYKNIQLQIPLVYVNFLLAWFNEILVFILASYTEECIWCLLTGGYFAKSFDPINNLNSFNCIKPLANNTSFDLSNFTISTLENCNAQKISMANPLISTSSFCDSSLYSFVKAINQTLNEDRPTYNRDFIRKFLFLKRFKGEWPLESNHEYFSVIGVQLIFLLIVQVFVVIRLGASSRCRVTRQLRRESQPLDVRECSEAWMIWNKHHLYNSFPISTNFFLLKF